MRYLIVIFFCLLANALCFGDDNWTITNAEFTVKDEKITSNTNYKNSPLDLLIQKNNLQKEDVKEPTHNTIKTFTITYSAQVKSANDGPMQFKTITQTGLLKTLDSALKEQILLKKNDLKVRYNPNDVNQIEFSFNGKIYPAPALISNQLPQLPKPHLVIPVTPLNNISPTNSDPNRN